MTQKKSQNKAKPKRKLISMGSNGEKNYSFSRAVVQGDWCFVAGTVGDNYDTGEIPDGVEQQTHNAFANIMAAMKAGGFELGHTVRVQYTVADRADIPKIQPILKHYFDQIRPAATMVVADLVDPKMKFEIEVTAYKG